jgi:hypothetical protein
VIPRAFIAIYNCNEDRQEVSVSSRSLDVIEPTEYGAPYARLIPMLVILLSFLEVNSCRSTSAAGIADPGVAQMMSAGGEEGGDGGQKWRRLPSGRGVLSVCETVRNTRSIFVMGLLACLGGSPPVTQRPITPPPPSKSIFDRPTPPPLRMWDQIQDPIDRSTGRIVDEPSYQLDRLQQRRDEDAGLRIEQRESERLREELERRMRIQEQSQKRQFANERERQAELDRREYELFITTGSSVAAQVQADQQTLAAAQGERNRKLLEAQGARSQALTQRPGDRAQIESEYSKQVEQIRQDYQRQREVILGVPPTTAPTTQPQ